MRRVACRAVQIRVSNHLVNRLIRIVAEVALGTQEPLIVGQKNIEI